MATKKRPSPSDTSASTPSSFVPEARGKAAALSSYLAQGGARVRRGGKYEQGPMKNKTLEQATQDFERLWVKAPDALKEKYASRSQKTDLAPSERGERKGTNATLNEARPGENYDQTQARFKASRTGKTTPAPAKPPMQAAPVTLQGEVAVQNSIQQNADKASATPPPIAAPGPRTENQRDKNARDTAPPEEQKRAAPEGLDVNDISKAPVGGFQAVTADANSDGKQDNADAEAAKKLPVDGNNQPIIPAADKPPETESSSTPASSTPPPIAGPKDKSTPFGRGIDATADAIGGLVVKGINTIKAPFQADVDAAKNSKSIADAQAATKASSEADAKARQVAVNEVNGAPASTPPPVAGSTSTPADAERKAEESRKFALEAGAKAVAARANNTPEQNKQEMDTAHRSSQALPSPKQEDEQRIMDAQKANPGARNPMSPNSPDPINTAGKPVAGKPPIAGPKEAADAKIGEAPPGMELVGTGWKRDAAGNKTNEREAKYAPVDDLYGKAKPSIPNTISNTPSTADPTKPVMIQGQNIEQRRADYQARSNTPQSRDAAGATLESMGVNANASGRTAPPIAGPRGPASQPEKNGSSLNNPNSAFSDAAYKRTADAQAQGVKRQEELAKQPTMDDVNRRFTPGTEEHRAAAYGVNPTTGAQLTKDDTKVDVRPAGRNDTMKPGTSRVVASRPASPEEIRTGNAGAPPPTIRRPQFARR